MRDALDSLLNAVAISSLDGLIIYVNPAFLALWQLPSEDAALGRPFADFWSTPDDVRDALARLPRTGSWNGVVRARLQGEEREFQASTALVRNPSGAPTAIIASLLDVTERTRAADALEHEREFARSLIDAAPAIVLVLTPDGLIEHVNPAFEKMTGWRLETIRGEDWFDVCVPVSERVRVRSLFEAALQGVATRGNVNAILTRTGEEREIEWHDQVLRDPQGRITGLLAMGLDVTERNRLATREAGRLRRLEQLSEVGLMLSGTPDAIISRVVRMLAVLFDMKAALLCKLEGDDLVLRFAFSGGEVRENIGSCLLSITPCNTVKESKDLRQYNQVQDRFPEAAFLREFNADFYCGVPVLGSDGETAAVICLLDEKPRDFSQEDEHVLRIVGQRIAQEIERIKSDAARRKVESDLARSEARLRQAQIIASLGNWELDLTTNQLWWSDEVFSLFEIDPSAFEASYEAFLNTIHPDDRERVDAAYTQSLRDKTPYRITHRLLTASGRVKIVEERCETDFSPEGVPLISRGTVQDVTAREEAENVVRESLLEKETLLREVHHRVKNNLQMISSLLHFQAKKVKDPYDSAAFAEARERLRAMALVHETLYESGSFARVDVAGYLRALGGELHRSFASQRRVTLQVAADDVALPMERALPCGMIMCELITNAFKYAFPDDKHGAVSVHLTADDGHIRLVVRDSGVGLPAQFDPAATTSFGWQLVRALTEQLGGTATVERAGGTTVAIVFPR